MPRNTAEPRGTSKPQSPNASRSETGSRMAPGVSAAGSFAGTTPFLGELKALNRPADSLALWPWLSHLPSLSLSPRFTHRKLSLHLLLHHLPGMKWGGKRGECHEGKGIWGCRQDSTHSCTEIRPTRVNGERGRIARCAQGQSFIGTGQKAKSWGG